MVWVASFAFELVLHEMSKSRHRRHQVHHPRHPEMQSHQNSKAPGRV